MQGTASKQLLGQNLILLPNRALMWREKRLLVVADPHFGKAQVFRDQGIPVPAGARPACRGWWKPVAPAACYF